MTPKTKRFRLRWKNPRTNEIKEEIVLVDESFGYLLRSYAYTVSYIDGSPVVRRAMHPIKHHSLTHDILTCGPNDRVIHLNRDGLDNRVANLKVVSKREADAWLGSYERN